MAGWEVVSETPATPPPPAVPKPGMDEGWKPVAAKKASDSTFQPWEDFKQYTKENFEAGKAGLAKPSVTENVAGLAGMALAPVGAAGHALVSKPAERALNIPAEQSDAALMFTPAGAGTAVGAANRALKAVPEVAKPLEKAWQVVAESPVARGAKATFSPTTMSKEAGQAEGVVREQAGMAERSTEQAKAKLEPEYEYLSKLPPDQQRAFIARIEGHSKGLKLADPRAEKAADTLRGIYHTVRNDLETDPNFDKMGFVQDYFPHLWQDPKKAQDFVASWARTGSSRNTQARSIPTIEDGIKAGLVPKTTNPAEITMQYVGNMYNYKALKGIQSTMTDQGLRKFSPRGSQQPGWVELKGPGNRVLFTDKKGAPHESVAYAPEDAARIYNRYYSPGFTGPVGQGVRALRNVVNNGTQMVLGMSAYHYRLLANESTAAALSKGTAKGLAEATPYGGMVRQYAKGKKVEEQYLGGQGGLDNKVIDYITRAGGRMKGVDKSMDMSAANSYWRAWQNGSVKAAMKADAMNIKAGGPMKVMMKTMGTVAEPLFTKTIPRIKNAVNYEAVAGWMKAHPGASEQEILKATRDIVDSTDNRFGELIQRNIFWDSKLKESAQLMMLSVGWALGTGRETVGGAKDLADFVSGKRADLTQRARYVLVAPVSHMLNASVYQALRGQGAPQDLQDLVYPRTGGTSPYDGMPERANLPSQMKDVIGYQKNGLQELQNKMAPVWRTALEMAENKNWRGDPLAYRDERLGPGWLKAYTHEIINSFTPISVAGALEKPMKGSKVGPLSKALGDRPASMAAEDPAGFKQLQDAMRAQAEKKGYRHQQTDLQRRQQ